MMNYFLSYALSIILTSLSYFIGTHILKKGIESWQALIIGFTVVSLGALTEYLGAPIWFIAYITVLALYTIIHIPMSYFFHFHSLIPAWKLS